MAQHVMALSGGGSSDSAEVDDEKDQRLFAARSWLSDQVKKAKWSGVFTSTVVVTPELAAALLEVNFENRPKHQKIREFARDMASGRWKHNGETIIVSDNGLMNDGQNRCYACIEAGVSFKTEMSFGVERASRKTVDIGVKRTVGHILQMQNYSDGNSLAHACSIAMTYNKYGAVRELTGIERPTPLEIQDWLEKNPQIQDSLLAGAAVATKLRQSKGLFAALYFVLSNVDEMDARTFFGRLASGANLTENDPIFRLRERLLDLKDSKRRTSHSEIAAWTIKCWNFFRGGQKRYVIGFRTKKNVKRGGVAEAFPTPR